MNDPLVRMILECTLRGTILIAFATLAAPLARRFFGKNGAHWLWLATLPALLWPVPPRTSLSLQNLWAHKKSAPISYVAPAPVAATAPPVVAKIRQLEPEPAVPAAITHSPASQSPVLLSPKPAHPVHWLLGLWLSGVLLSLALLARRWFGTMRMLRDARPVNANRALQLLRRFPAFKRVSIAVTSQVRAPALAGIWRPRILLPEGWLDSLPDHELESVLLHELGHYLRGDLVWEWLFAFARCLHWMNPAVWLAERMARHERELACDAWALERSASPVHYGEALLEALQRVHHYTAPTFGVVAMADGIRQISRRLRWITSYRPAPRWRAAAAWIPALLALAAVGSNPLPLQADGPAATPAPAPAAAEPSPAPAPAAAPPPAAVEVPPNDPLPLAKRPIEIKTEIIRLPESAANQLGWPIAENGSKGIQRILSRAQFRQMIGSVGPQTELLLAPRLTSRSGYRGQTQAIREFRYGKDYKASAPSVPGSIQTVNLGMTLEWQADINSETAVHLNILPTLTRLSGFENANHTLTPSLTSPPGTDWYHRLVAYAMPDGTSGTPVISTQEGNADMDLNCDQTAVVFGFRDADRTPAPGTSKEQTMVVYFAIQIDIAQ